MINHIKKQMIDFMKVDNNCRWSHCFYLFFVIIYVIITKLNGLIYSVLT